MPVLTDRLAYLHIPKTGGTWIMKALESVGIEFRREKPQHGTLQGNFENRFIYTQVRCPITWLASAYCFVCASRSWPGNKRHAAPIKSLDTSTFQAWVNNWIDIGLSVHDFFHDYTVQADLVGRTESCVIDLRQALMLSGHRFNKDKLDIKRVNSRHSSFIVDWSASIIDRIRKTQDGAFTAYGYDKCFNIESCPCALGG